MHGEARAIDGCASLQLVDRGAQDVPVPDPDVEWGQPGELTEERTDEWVVGIASACPPSPGGPQARLGQHRGGQLQVAHGVLVAGRVAPRAERDPTGRLGVAGDPETLPPPTGVGPPRKTTHETRNAPW